jgi:muramoyltetrapeptide carboxypeptidase
MREIIKPRPLEPGMCVGVFTPSFPANVAFREKYLHGVAQLDAMGLRVKEGPLTARMASQGYRSGSPAERAAEVMALIEDAEVDALVATIGGSNTSSILPLLDYGAIRDARKIICGYSDVTALHMAVLTQSQLSTLYGPAVMPSFGEWPQVLPETAASFMAACHGHRRGERALVPPAAWSRHLRSATTGAWRTEPRQMEPQPGWVAQVAGAVEARCVVANLNTLLCLAGTRFFPDLTGKLLLIEEMAAPMSRLERNLRQLELMGVFDRIAGLVLSKPELPDAEGAPFSEEMLLAEVVGPRAYPILTGFDCGHTNPMLTIAQDTMLRITASQAGEPAQVVVLEPMVEG